MPLGALSDGHEIINAATLYTQSDVAVAFELTDYSAAVDATEYSLKLTSDGCLSTGR